MALPVVCALAIIIAFGLRAGFVPAALVAALAYMAPSFYIGHKTKLRKKAIRNGLPDALDLLTVCTEAGSGLDQAIGKASEELVTAHPVLAQELRLITTEIRAGKPRLEAFQEFSRRGPASKMCERWCRCSSRRIRFGTSVADALRVQSDTSRTKRRQEAEETLRPRSA
jgi:tight adherence protein C